MLYDRNIIGTSSEIFGYLRQSSENARRRSSSLRNNFEKSSEIGMLSEIFGKSSTTSLLVCLYNKQNNTWTLGDMEFIFSCSHSISHSFPALIRSISMWTLEDTFHISVRSCIILYIRRKYLYKCIQMHHANNNNNKLKMSLSHISLLASKQLYPRC